MTTGSRAIAQLAGATGIMQSRIDRASVALQSAGMWPMGARGGGRTTPHVDPEHLVNLTVAIACADPITSAAEAVRRYRPLILIGDDKVETTVGALLDSVLPSTSSVMLNFVLDTEYPEASILVDNTVLTSSVEPPPHRPRAALTRTVSVPFGFFDALRDILQE